MSLSCRCVGAGLWVLLLLVQVANAGPDAGSDAGPDQEPAARLRDLLADLSAVRHIEADFRDEKHSGILQFALVSNGRFEFQAPDIIIRETRSPKPGLFEVRGDHIRIERDGKVRLVDTRDQPMLAAMLRALRAILAGDQAYLDTLFSLQMTSDARGWSLLLRPREQRLRQVIEWLEVAGHAAVIDRLSIHQPSGDYTDTVFSAQRVR